MHTINPIEICFVPVITPMFKFLMKMDLVSPKGFKLSDNDTFTCSPPCNLEPKLRSAWCLIAPALTKKNGGELILKQAKKLKDASWLDIRRLMEKLP